MLNALAQFTTQPSPQWSTQPTAELSAGALTAILVVALALVALVIVEMWIVFRKAHKPGWAAIVPIYNAWVLAEVGGKPGWWGLLFLLSIIPLVGPLIVLVVSIIIAVGVATNFGKSGLFSLLLIFLPFIGYGTLAFGSASYRPQVPAAGR